MYICKHAISKSMKSCPCYASMLSAQEISCMHACSSNSFVHPLLFLLLLLLFPLLHAGKKTLTIVVNLKECKFQFFKTGDSQRVTYEHHQLLQLVKSRSKETRLSVIFEGQGRKEYTFNDMQVRGVVWGGGSGVEVWGGVRACGC